MDYFNSPIEMSTVANRQAPPEGRMKVSLQGTRLLQYFQEQAQSSRVSCAYHKTPSKDALRITQKCVNYVTFPDDKDLY